MEQSEQRRECVREEMSRESRLREIYAEQLRQEQRHTRRLHTVKRYIKPRDAEHLRRYVQSHLGMVVSGRRVCSHHNSPLEYLWHVYRCDFPEYLSNRKPMNGDCIVWANRGGGKTQLAAAATLLEGVFKPGCQTRILAGSLDQSCRTYEYLMDFVHNGFEEFVEGKMLKGSCRFKNGATVQVLPQSSRAVRGRHIHKLRCDEMEMFDEDVFNAAKFVTRSGDGLLGGMEMLSTMHRPYGLMQQLIEDAPKSHIPVFKWCVWEVIERCRGRSCDRCPLDDDCQGKAKLANGYLRIDDVITQMRRSSRAGFESEMLCLRPHLENAVFDEFDEKVHVRKVGYDPSLPLYRAVDFGFKNPFVCLWIQVDVDGVVRVIDEYVREKKIVAIHADAIIQRTRCAEHQVAMTFCDPAGAGRNGVTGTSEIKVFRDKGIRCKWKKSGILEGIEKVRSALRTGDGQSRLVIDPGCKKLIEALRSYHYPKKDVLSELPEKDGTFDHPIDALRYFFVNVERKGEGVCQSY